MKYLQFLVLAVCLTACSTTNQTSTNALIDKQTLKRENYQEVINPAAKQAVSEGMPGQFPMYPGGFKGLMKNVAQKTIYPKYELSNKIEGIVMVAYTINKDGSISDAQVVKSVSEGLDKEAIRLTSQLKPWYPAIQNGKPVNIRFVQPFNFKLQKT